jgi:hypothetical protein
MGGCLVSSQITVVFRGMAVDRLGKEVGSIRQRSRTIGRSSLAVVRNAACDFRGFVSSRRRLDASNRSSLTW